MTAAAPAPLSDRSPRKPRWDFGAFLCGMVRRGIYLSVINECLYAWPPGLLTAEDRAEIERHRGTIIRKLDWRIGRKPKLRRSSRGNRGSVGKCRVNPNPDRPRLGPPSQGAGTPPR